MNYNDETFYIEFFINGILKVDSESKKRKVKKLQKLLNKIVEDESLELIKSDSSLTVMSEGELIQSLMPYDDTPNQQPSQYICREHLAFVLPTRFSQQECRVDELI